MEPRGSIPPPRPAVTDGVMPPKTPDHELEVQLDRAADEAVRVWGARHQMGVTQEECAELIAAVSHVFRKRSGLEKVAAEVADVEMMLRQVRKVIEARLPADTMRKARLASLTRLNRNIDAELEARRLIPLGAGSLESWDGGGDF